MPIAITCSGCSAAFQVPDELVGKTIRCTSCKTQVSVPETAAVAQAGAKKPFGWVGSSSTTTATTDDRAPLSLDDDTPQPTARTVQVAKSVPPAKAAVAKKPTVKQDVVVDNDEDDEEENIRNKTNPNKSSSKVAAKSSAKSRRDDDEEDDDEEDDRPRLKKKSKNKSKDKGGGGSGALIAVIAVGVLALVAVAGGGIYLLTGNDKKKDETASSSSDSTPSSPPPPGKSSPPSGSGNSGGASSSGGMPSGSSPSSSGRPPGGSSGGPPGGSGSSGGQHPSGPSAPPGRPPGGSSGGPPGSPGFGGGPPGQGGWQRFTLDGFSAEMPGRPRLKENQSVLTAAGRIPIKSYVLDIPGADEGFIVISATLPVAVETPEATEAFFTGAIDGLEKQNDLLPDADKISLGATTDVKQDDFPGKEIQLVQKDGSGTGGGVIRIVLAKTKFYLFGAGSGNYPAFQEQAKRFMSSVKLSANFSNGGNYAMGGQGGGPQQPPGSGGGPPQPPPGSGGGPPGGGPPGGPNGGGGQGQPPGGPGMPGRPPGGGPGMPGRPGGPGGAGATDRNPPPQGADTNGKQKHKIDPFFTAAFDLEKKSFFTITSRSEKGKLLGTLARYDYPGFALQATFVIPHLATRAVIDPAKHLLYVTTTHTSATSSSQSLMQQQYDLASALGDIQIFDLEPLCDTKVQPTGELKPLATIPIGKTIRGFELSNDGKYLFVATTSSTKPITSTLLKIDTETHKSEKPLVLKEAIWEMRKSADGKSLLVLDGIQGATKSSVIHVYNPDTLSEESTVQVQGVGNHLASAPGSSKHQMAVTIAGTGGPTIPSKLMLTGDGGPQEVSLGIGWKAAVNASIPGYVEYSPNGKMLFISAFRAAGLDAYEVTDIESPTGLKKKASIRTAGGPTGFVGGHFFVSPDGAYLVDHHGIVLDTSDIGGSNGEAANVAGTPGRPGGSGGPTQPGSPGSPSSPPGGPAGSPGSPGAPSAIGPPGGAGGAAGNQNPPGKPPAGGGTPGAPPGGPSPIKPPAGQGGGSAGGGSGSPGTPMPPGKPPGGQGSPPPPDKPPGM
jgi:hypothetical protein